jgi:hypothetical protein
MKAEFLASVPVVLAPCHLGAPVFSTIGVGLALAFGFAQGAVAQQNPLTAIDIALEPDATMLQHAMAANARLLKSFPKGFTLDETHRPHVTMLQQFVHTDDLDKVFAAAPREIPMSINSTSLRSAKTARSLSRLRRS